MNIPICHARKDGKCGCEYGCPPCVCEKCLKLHWGRCPQGREIKGAKNENAKAE